MSLEELNEHSPVGPSSGDRWIHCPGSVPATKDLPDSSSDFAAEGTFAHYISELCRNEDKEPKEYLGVVSEDGKFEVNQEMVDGLDNFLAYCDQFDGDTFVELRVNYDEWVQDGFGTGDHIAVDDKGTALIMDLKYGKGIQINAKGNTQLKLYALGFWQDYSHLYDIENFVLAISQPRLGHRDQWDISTEKLLRWAEDVVVPAGIRVEEAQKAFDSDNEIPDEYFKAGGWCQWCRIRGTCKTRAALVRETVMIDVEDIDDVKPLHELDDDELGVSFGMLAMIRKWCTDIEEAVSTAVSKGAKIKSGEDEDGNDEFYFFTEGRSNREWRDPKAAEKRLRGARLKVDEMFTKKLIGPAPAERLLGKAHKIIKEEVIKPQGKPVLVAGSDPREPFKAATTDEMDDLDDDDGWLD
jgi:hypothetical protein